MDVIEVLRCLAEADADQRRPELCGGRYVLACIQPDDFVIAAEDESSAADSAFLTETSSLYGALDEWASVIVGLSGDDSAKLTHRYRGKVPELDYAGWLDPDLLKYASALSKIQTPPRRILAYFVLGILSASMDVVTADHWRDPYLGWVANHFSGARVLFLVSAAPPRQDEAYTILECQPTGTPQAVDRALSTASQAGDIAAVTAALAAGAEVNALDERGMTALHLAVAHRHLAVVTALLTAGADPGLQSEYGNAAQFAGLSDDPDGVLPTVARIEDADHEQILRVLLDAGAPINAGNRTGVTLLDLAIRTQPYPKVLIDLLCSRGAQSSRVSPGTLSDLLDYLPHGNIDDLEIRANQIRFLLETGADPNQPGGHFLYRQEPPLHALLAGTGYDTDDVPPQLLLELVDELLRHGAGAGHPADLRAAIEYAEGWVSHGFAHYQAIIDRLSAALNSAPAAKPNSSDGSGTDVAPTVSR